MGGRCGGKGGRVEGGKWWVKGWMAGSMGGGSEGGGMWRRGFSKSTLRISFRVFKDLGGSSPNPSEAV